MAWRRCKPKSKQDQYVDTMTIRFAQASPCESRVGVTDTFCHRACSWNDALYAHVDNQHRNADAAETLQRISHVHCQWCSCRANKQRAYHKSQSAFAPNANLIAVARPPQSPKLSLPLHQGEITIITDQKTQLLELEAIVSSDSFDSKSP